MGLEARRALREKRWLRNAEGDIEQLRERLRTEPDNRSLAALVRMADEVMAHQRRKLQSSA
ncbi:hypothetical protein [Tahibacter soli]|jgi:hypothetical protein|uniref:Uncharacterized protein n=1 Tax=Tahibacter soli TaxID=2983605 RepID=A0A9X4BFR6_9GAMM|nr:hypothetical protein [Tahibacter soli]MDC8011640.1 hypothetical protein [Tahibacter soli]